MKQFIKSLFVYFLILFFVIGLFNKGIVLPTIPLYFFVSILILTLTVMVAGPLLKFLTIKANFPTHFLMSAILLVGVFFLLKIFMTGLYINDYVFEGISWGTIEIASFVVTPTITIVGVSLLSALICSIYKELDSV
ncbi:hypothetical protein KKA50_00815 [Patescibacteria group bacterium]|nr:hypothetical protein [Patescibacteria group bacterium]